MFFYLGTPYSRYGRGRHVAFMHACQQAALLLTAGVPVFCPIAHSHPIADFGKIDALDLNIWLPADEPMMRAASALIVCQLPGWDTSVGIKHEIEFFLSRGKRVIYMTPDVVPAICLDPAWKQAA